MKNKYTQDDAEFLAEWFNKNNSMQTTIISKPLRDAFDKSDNLRSRMTKDLFENSDFRFKFKKSYTGKVKAIVKWEKENEKSN